MSEFEKLLQESQKVKEQADCLYDKEQVLNAVKQLAVSITRKLADCEPVVLAVMNGGMIPMGVLVTELDFPMQLGYLHATRYRDKTQGGHLQWLSTPTLSLSDRTVLLIDDIHDEGVTLDEIKSFCLKEGARDVYSAVLVNKVHERKNNTFADFVGLEVPDRYVFGFGMDYKGMLRNAPGIYAVKNM